MTRFSRYQNVDLYPAIYALKAREAALNERRRFKAITPWVCALMLALAVVVYLFATGN